MTSSSRAGSTRRPGRVPRPIRVFYQDGVACYATLQVGECDQIHVMAAGQEQLDRWRADGVEIVEGSAPREGLSRRSPTHQGERK